MNTIISMYSALQTFFVNILRDISRKKLLAIFSFLMCICVSHAKVWAQAVVTLQSKKENAAVYAEPDFDAKIIYLLPRGKKLVGTRSTREGISGLGLFHKVKLNSKTYGYVLDTEVVLQGSAKSDKKKNDVKNKSVSLEDNSKKKDSESFQKKQQSDSKKPSKNLKQETDGWDYTAEELAEARVKKEQEELRKKKEAEKKRNKPKDPKTMTPFERYTYEMNKRKRKQQEKPLFLKTMVGGQVGLVNYTEKVTGGKKRSQELVYGLKLSGTNIVFNNFLTDLSVMLHWGAPSYYDDFSTEASGFFALVDLTFPFILSRNESRYVYGGIGPMLNMSFFNFKVLGDKESSQKVRLGGVGTLGLAYKMGESWAFKMEGKYYFERASYWGVLAGIQKSF